MMAVLKSSSFRLYISFSLGLFSVYLLLSFCSGDLMYFFILLDVVDLCLCMEIEFSCSFHLFQLLFPASLLCCVLAPALDVRGSSGGVRWKKAACGYQAARRGRRALSYFHLLPEESPSAFPK